MKRIAIIPARSGSKGLKDKNIKELNGKPLIAYSIECAIDSGMFDKVFVSTDSLKYANIAIQYGADASFLRSKENSSDSAGSWDVVREVIERLKEQGEVYDDCKSGCIDPFICSLFDQCSVKPFCDPFSSKAEGWADRA